MAYIPDSISRILSSVAYKRKHELAPKNIIPRAPHEQIKYKVVATQ